MAETNGALTRGACGFFFQAEDGIRDDLVTGVQTCALPISITNVQRAYWDLVFALRNLQIQRDAVRDARTQLDHNKRMVNEGQLAPIDIVAAEAQIAGFEQALFSALEDVSRSENSLKNLIAQNRQTALLSDSIVPADSVDLVVPEGSLPHALKTAMDNRPELQQSNVAREINQIHQR